MSTELHSMGWIPRPLQARAYAETLPKLDDFWEALAAKDDGGDRFFYRALTDQLSKVEAGEDWLEKRDGVTVLKSYHQGSVGSCVGNAEAERQSEMAAIDIVYRLDSEKFKGMFIPEWPYYASRKQAGLLRSGDGSTGYGAALAAASDGALVAGTYGGVDVSVYTEERCRLWGKGKSIPDEAVAEAAKHKYTKYLKVTTAKQIWTAAGFGLVYNQCSSLGWESTRDKDGAISRAGSWMHSMCAGMARYTTKAGRKLILIRQSWGNNWTTGPYYLDQPQGSFYVDLDDAAEAAAQGDTFVDIGFIGDEADLTNISFTEM